MGTWAAPLSGGSMSRLFCRLFAAFALVVSAPALASEEGEQHLAFARYAVQSDDAPSVSGQVAMLKRAQRSAAFALAEEPSDAEILALLRAIDTRLRVLQPVLAAERAEEA